MESALPVQRISYIKYRSQSIGVFAHHFHFLLKTTYTVEHDTACSRGTFQNPLSILFNDAYIHVLHVLIYRNMRNAACQCPGMWVMWPSLLLSASSLISIKAAARQGHVGRMEGKRGSLVWRRGSGWKWMDFLLRQCDGDWGCERRPSPCLCPWEVTKGEGAIL